MKYRIVEKDDGRFYVDWKTGLLQIFWSNLSVNNTFEEATSYIQWAIQHHKYIAERRRRKKIIKVWNQDELV
jgi:hypothetical protein